MTVKEKLGVRVGLPALGILAAVMMLMIAGTAQSAVRYAGGNNGILNPSTTDNFELGPWRISENVETSGATTATALEVGQKITFMGGKVVFSAGPIYRVFGPFNFVAQNTNFRSSMRVDDVVFSQNNGAAGAANISYCPPINDPNPLNGNLSCSLTTQAGAGTYNIAIRIAKTGNNNGFGGVYALVRGVDSNVWFALSPFVPLGNTTQEQVVSNQDRDLLNTWTPGPGNFAFFTDMNSRGPRYRALLTNEPDPPGQNIQGGIMTLLNPNSPTPPLVEPPSTAKGWGFKMTTGIVSGSDKVPAATSFVSTGKDTVTAQGNVRNLVLIGGGVATSTGSGTLSLFNRNMRMRFSVFLTPEPGTVVALGAGVLGLVALARTRRD